MSAKTPEQPNPLDFQSDTPKPKTPRAKKVMVPVILAGGVPNGKPVDPVVQPVAADEDRATTSVKDVAVPPPATAKNKQEPQDAPRSPEPATEQRLAPAATTATTAEVASRTIQKFGPKIVEAIDSLTRAFAKNTIALVDLLHEARASWIEEHGSEDGFLGAISETVTAALPKGGSRSFIQKHLRLRFTPEERKLINDEAPLLTYEFNRMLALVRVPEPEKRLEAIRTFADGSDEALARFDELVAPPAPPAPPTGGTADSNPHTDSPPTPPVVGDDEDDEDEDEEGEDVSVPRFSEEFDLADGIAVDRRYGDKTLVVRARYMPRHGTTRVSVRIK